jgi:integrase/recombinase XerD
MAAAKSLTPAELERVLQYMSHRSFAQRNRAMLMMTVAAGLRVGEVAGLTLGDVLEDDGTVRGEIYLAAHRTKHNHARTIYLNTRLQAELAAYIHRNMGGIVSSVVLVPVNPQKYFGDLYEIRSAPNEIFTTDWFPSFTSWVFIPTKLKTNVLPEAASIE